MATTNEKRGSRPPRKIELAAVIGFVVLNLTVPWVVGECYPFTVSPMFRDSPSQYCVYEVLNPDGKPVGNLADFGLHLVYDGNPPGLGMGIIAPPTIHAFGEVSDEQTVCQRVREVLQGNTEYEFVTVKQTHVHGEDHRICKKENVWRIDLTHRP